MKAETAFKSSPAHDWTPERIGQLGTDDIRQRIAEIPVLAAPEAVLLHHDALAKPFVVAIQPGKSSALVHREHRFDRRAAAFVEIRCNVPPIDRVDALSDGFSDERTHARASRSSSVRLRSTPQR